MKLSIALGSVALAWGFVASPVWADATADVAALQRIAAAQGLSAHYLGLVGEADSDLIVNRDGRGWTWQTAALRQKYFDAIPRRMAAPVTATGEE